MYRHYAAPLHRYLARTFQVRAGGAATAATSTVRLGVLDLEDAHQEAFMRAFAERQRLSYDGLRPFLGYLCVMGRSAAVDCHRRCTRRRLRSGWTGWSLPSGILN